MKTSKAVEGYSIAKLSGGYSPRTIERYQYPFIALINYLDDPPIQDVDLIDLRKFMHWYATEFKPTRWSGDIKPLSPSSVDNAWKAIRSLFGWAEDELGIPRPDLRLERPKYRTPIQKPLSRDDVAALLKACNRTGGSKNPQRRRTAIRDKALILILLDTGIRLGELHRLTFADVTYDESQRTYQLEIKPYSTGEKTQPRFVYLGKQSTGALWRYLAQKDEQHPNDFLFTTVNGLPLNQYNIKNLLNNLGRKAGVSKVNPHRFRHTFAITFLRNSGDVFTLQRILGHSSLDMVKRYLALADIDDKGAHRRESPADRWHLG